MNRALCFLSTLLPTEESAGSPLKSIPSTGFSVWQHESNFFSNFDRIILGRIHHNRLRLFFWKARINTKLLCLKSLLKHERTSRPSNLQGIGGKVNRRKIQKQTDEMRSTQNIPNILFIYLNLRQWNSRDQLLRDERLDCHLKINHKFKQMPPKFRSVDEKFSFGRISKLYEIMNPSSIQVCIVIQNWNAFPIMHVLHPPYQTSLSPI